MKLSTKPHPALSPEEANSLLKIAKSIQDLMADGIMSEILVEDLQCSKADLQKFIAFTNQSQFIQKPKNTGDGVDNLHIEVSVDNGKIHGLYFVSLEKMGNFLEKIANQDPKVYGKHVFALELSGLVYKPTGKCIKIRNGTRKILELLAEAKADMGTQELAAKASLGYRSISKTISDINNRIEEEFSINKNNFLTCPTKKGSGGYRLSNHAKIVVNYRS